LGVSAAAAADAAIPMVAMIYLSIDKKLSIDDSAIFP
jgi:hypothetical protein